MIERDARRRLLRHHQRARRPASTSGLFRRHIDATGLGYPREIELVAALPRPATSSRWPTPSPRTRRGRWPRRARTSSASTWASRPAAGSGPRRRSTSTRPVPRHRRCSRRRSAGRDDVLVVAHGGPFEDPATVARVFETTDVVGYLGASSIERLPVERAVSGVVREFKALRPRVAGSSGPAGRGGRGGEGPDGVRARRPSSSSAPSTRRDGSTPSSAIASARPGRRSRSSTSGSWASPPSRPTSPRPRSRARPAPSWRTCASPARAATRARWPSRR